MSSEIAIPFRLNEGKKIAVETNPNGQIRQHVMSLLNTEPGERAVLGDYGVPLSEMLFEAGDESMVADLGDRLLKAFATWEPGVTLRDVSPEDTHQHDGLAKVNIQYMRTDAPDTPAVGRSTNVAIIRAGGQVSEVIRG